jgi:FKBP-type peptidyl-prolyl cis-trans isomerase
MDIAIKSMKKSEKSLFRFTSDYAYGADGCPGKGSTLSIEKNQTIQFEIELVDSIIFVTPAEIRQKEDEARLIEIRSEREIKAKLIEEQKILKQNQIDEKKKKDDENSVIIENGIVFDKKWAKGLKPKLLKDELKKRNLSLQGNKNELLSRLLESIA